MDNKLAQNQNTWDKVAEHFFDASALPEWGPFGVGTDLDLIPEIADKTFLEIACGSGRSIKYLIDNGASKVLALDISQTQLDEAKRFNSFAIDKGSVELFHQPMEDLLSIDPVDYVISIYGFGWTQDPKKALQNVFKYLKSGGLFIWSWDHTIFSDVVYKDGDYVVEHSYHEENEIELKNWKKEEGATIYLTYRKTSTWFQMLTEAGFEVVAYYEPAPQNFNRGSEDPERYYSIEKAKKIPVAFIFVCRKK